MTIINAIFYAFLAIIVIKVGLRVAKISVGAIDDLFDKLEEKIKPTKKN